VSKTLEVRVGKHQPVELRSADGGLGVLSGYAIVYNSLSQNLGGFVEQILPGAADKSLADQVRTVCRYNHDDNYLLGTTTAGTLRMASDGTGMSYDVDLPDTTAGRDVRELARRGDIGHSSFAFYVPPDGEEWGLTDNGFPLRTIRSLQLVDVAPVNSPAYLDTTAGLRSLSARTGIPVPALPGTPLDEVRSLISKPTRANARAANDPADASMLTQAMAWFTAVDSIVDEAQEALAGYLAVPSPDPDDAEDMPAGMPVRSLTLARARLEMLRRTL
jgi:HK97 family phage prohead protease